MVTLILTGQAAALNEEGQLSDRYAHAADLLKSDDSYGRIAGIEAVARIVQDRPDERSTVVTMLGTFIRAQTPPVHSDACDQSARPALEVNEAITAISRLNSGGDGTQSISLRDSCLRGIDIINRDLAGVDFGGADLTRAAFFSADLGNTRFAFADLTYAKFVGNDLTSASLCYSNLDGTSFQYGDYTATYMSSWADPAVWNAPYMARAQTCLDGSLT